MFFPGLSSGSSAAGGLSTSALSGQTQGMSGKPDDITGKFDPTALERGAKALKELDASTNAAKAFEVVKLQEVTKQKELQKDIEEIATSRARANTERAKVDNEERRKTIDHQQEQERVTAQYKARLEAEAYQKKLLDQQKQNEEWLRQQHQQFLAQENARKRTEAEMLEMRRKQMHEEKSLERENMQARIREETKGRISQERENIDIHLRSLRAQAAENRKTRLEVISAIFSGVGSGANALLSDKTKLTTFVGTATALALGIYGARSGASLAGRWLESRIGKPQLIRETSRWVFSRSFQAFNPFFFLHKKKAFDSLENIVLEPGLSERLTWTTNALVSAKASGTPFRHMCLYGSPGTGKTLFARTLSKQSGLDYALLSGGDVGPLGKDAVAELNKVFKWAEKSRKGLILFIDEADAFLRQGRNTMSGMSEEMRNALSAFLYHTGSESKHFCVVLATNVKEIFDPAILDRIDELFEFSLPGPDERKRMLAMFMDRYVFTPQKSRKFVVDEKIDAKFIENIAEKTEGFSGRQLAKLCISLQAAMFGSGTGVLSEGLANVVIDWKLKQFQQEKLAKPVVA